MIYPLEKFFRKWRRQLSRTEWALRRLHLQSSEDADSAPGLLLIQIDGLSRTEFERALARGRMPFVRSLVQRQHYELATFYSGLPSTTPAVQGELFYGVCCAVPAFSFLNRRARRITAMFQPEWVKKLEADLKKRGAGLLAGGSSWSNIYTGGAAPEESHFCAASLGPGDFLKSVSLFGLVSILILQLPSVLRLVGLLVLEALLAFCDIIKCLFRRENPIQEIKFILSRVFVCVGLRELATIGAGVDLARGLPIVHVNFLAYDEPAHRRGPRSPLALWALRNIDLAIKKLYRDAHRSIRRDYQVWIYSDHGHEHARSFLDRHPGGIESVIEQAIAQCRRGAVPRGTPPDGTFGCPFAAGQHNEDARQPTGDSGLMLAKGDGEKLFSVTAMGPVGHLYLAWSLTPEEKRTLAEWLVHRGDVPGVLYRTEPGKAVWVHQKGIWRLPEDAAIHLPHPGRLKEVIGHDLVQLCEQQYSGDMVLLGWVPDGQPWTFALERGAHGGLGLDETRGFALLPSGTRLPDSVHEFIRPLDLRKAALHRLGRETLPRRKRVADLAPAYRLRVMTYNVHSCLGMDGRVSPQRIARVIELFSPDVVALQEIDLGKARTRGHDQAKMIAEDLHMQVHFCPTVVRGAELYGHALLSQWPMAVVCTGGLAAGNGAARREPRGALLGCVDLEAAKIYILNTHFGLGRLERAAQAADLMGGKWLGQVALEQPLIVCGDFNMLPGSLPYRALASRLRDVQLELKNFQPLKTFAALYPFSRIDHIFVSHHFEVQKIQVPQNDLTRVASDHLPLIADLLLKA